MKTNKEKVSITIDGEIMEKIKELAEEDDRSVSQYINIILKKHIEIVSRHRKRSEDI